VSLLLVGGFGFVGKHLIERLKSYGIRFTVITKRDPEVAWAKCPYVLDNTLDDKTLKQLAVAHDTVVYMASSSIPTSGSFLRELSENVEPAVKLIDKLTTENPNMNVLYLSSGGQIYGNDYNRPMSETDVCCPVSPYGYGKLMIEKSLEYLHLTKGVKIAILRVANPVGRWQTKLRQGIVNVVLQSIKSGEPVNIFGTGEEVRDYLDADELAELIIKVAAFHFEFELWNVGSGEGTSTASIIAKIENVVGIKVEKKYLPRRKVDPVSAVLNCRKLQTLLGWKTHYSIDQILEKTISQKMESTR
jgi:UDP-glucose 4-epimerase